MQKNDFIKNLKLLREIDPENNWLPLIERGYSIAGIIYMKKAMKAAGLSIFIAEKNQNKSTENRAEKKILTTVQNKLNKLYQKRTELSNTFHILETQFERAKNSKNIQAIQKQIAELYRQIEFYEATGTLAKEFFDEYELPNDKYLLAKKINSFRAAISRARKEIVELEKSGENIKALQKQKKKLAEKLIQKAYAEQKLEKL